MLIQSLTNSLQTHKKQNYSLNLSFANSWMPFRTIYSPQRNKPLSAHVN